MDLNSTLEPNSASLAEKEAMLQSRSNRAETPSISAGIAAASAHANQPAAGWRFAGDNGGGSVAEMAHRDLDAALQLLAERAQYITAASGAAIALRRGENSDMLCRASTGSSAPELGALLSMEYGLSGECVRTRQLLRCDDAEVDARVNHEVCRQLGIASVVLMPIVGYDHVLGIFELFSGKPRAFEERDILALQRLSEMVETAVRHAVAAQSVPANDGAAALAEPAEANAAAQHTAAPGALVAEETAPAVSPVPARLPDVNHSASEIEPLPQPAEPITPQAAAPEKVELEEIKAEPAPKKPLFWSAAMHSQGGSQAEQPAERVDVPPVLRNLRKCEACGFPVSQGRKYCVECEEKQWKGQSLPKPGVAAKPQQDPPQESHAGALGKKESAPAPVKKSSAPTALEENTERKVPASTTVVPSNESVSPLPSDPEKSAAANHSTLFLGSVQSDSWFVANKYILGALVVVIIILSAFAVLR